MPRLPSTTYPFGYSASQLTLLTMQLHDLGPALHDLGPALHHLALGSPDVERAARFYCEVIGLKELTRHFDSGGSLRSIWLTLDASILMIEHTQEPLRHVEGVGSGLFLLAFTIRPEQRAQLEQQLSSRGHVIEAATQWSFYTRDPDGQRVAFSHYPIPRVPELNRP